MKFLPFSSTEHCYTKNALTLQSSESECIQDYKRNIELSATTKNAWPLKLHLEFYLKISPVMLIKSPELESGTKNMIKVMIRWFDTSENTEGGTARYR